MPDVRAAVIAAAAREAAAVRRALRVRVWRSLPEGRCWEGNAGGGTVALVRAGVGPERAAAAARMALEAFRPGALLVLGFAGALRDGIIPGTMVLAATTRLEGEGWAGDAGLLAAAERAVAAAGIPAVRGDLVTVPALAATPEAKAALAAATGAVAVDMEAAAVASVAARAGLPFLAAKVIFDGTDEFLHPALLDVVGPDGSPRFLRAALLAARDRDLRAAFHWAARRSRMAARLLTRFCRALLAEISNPLP